MKSCDIWNICNQDHLVAIEVAMSSTHERANIEMDFEKASVDVVVVGCINQKVLDEVGNIVKAMPEKYKIKTRGFLLSEILKKDPEEFVKKIVGE